MKLNNRKYLKMFYTDLNDVTEDFILIDEDDSITLTSVWYFLENNLEKYTDLW